MRGHNGREALIVSILILAGATRTFAAAPFPAQLPGTLINQNLPADVEPSGLVWHSRLNQLFLISDNGWLHRMNLDGTNVTSWMVWGDVEAVTVADPATNFVYIARENEYRILEFNFVTGTTTRVFELSAWITAPPNLGIEGLTFVNVAGDPEGGVFYVGMQGDCRILKFSLPVKTSTTSTAATYLGTLPAVPNASVIGDLNYDSTTDTLYVLYNGSDVIRALRPDGTPLGEWVAPLVYQEALAINPSNCEIYVGDDTGPVYRYSGLFIGDADSDGVADCADDCPGTGAAQTVDANGCSCNQTDADHDGVADCADSCPSTPAGESVDANGCACSQQDSDGDGVSNCTDACPDTSTGQSVNAAGCSCHQLDADQDDVVDCADSCPGTPTGERVDANGCGCSQRDTDSDGINDCLDLVPGPNDIGDTDPPNPDSPQPPIGGVSESGTPAPAEPEAGRPDDQVPALACGMGAASMAPFSLLGIISMRLCMRRRCRI